MADGEYTRVVAGAQREAPGGFGGKERDLSALPSATIGVNPDVHMSAAVEIDAENPA